MFAFLTAWLSLLCLAAALPASSLDERGDGYSSPRQVMYIQTFHYTNGGQLSLLPLVEQKTGVTHILLAAVHINSTPGDVELNDDSTNSTVYTQIWSEAAQLQKDGVKVMMMLGGAAPGSYPNLCSGTNGAIINEAYYTPLRDTLRYHNVDGLDLDIEEQPASAIALSTRAATASGRPNGKLVNWYNAQFYNGWGDASTPIGYNAIIANGYAPDRVVLGVLDNPNDAGSGFYRVGTYKTTIATLRANYHNFGGDAGWEFWDAGASDGYANPSQWVSDIATAVFGSSSDDKSALRNLQAAPIPRGPTPWPHLISTLETLGVGFLPAVRALNLTDGNLHQALKVLDLPEIVPLRPLIG
ncbi:glycoside hydrolase family 18 [Lecanosticta acicola]|uniref:Glycoside hydrolase family 18 n=1 Tax=Lecanosticta acicola TaxID=111012 RepID=A0AAI8Z595_9PEZI|nr:glycoside hydrolase family 18 [Lecanosticta acicola]